MSAPALPVTKAPVGDLAKVYYSLDGTTFTEFADVKKFKKNKIKSPKVPTSNLQSTAETSQPGRPEFGEMELTIGHNANLTNTITGWMVAKTVLQFKSQINDGSNLTSGTSDIITGFVSEFDAWGEVKENEQILSDITITASGSDTFTAGT